MKLYNIKNYVVILFFKIKFETKMQQKVKRALQKNKGNCRAAELSDLSAKKLFSVFRPK